MKKKKLEKESRKKENLKKNKLIREFEHLETRHKVGLFLGVLIITVFITRIGVQFVNPNPVIFNLELHHFDYGLILLIITVLLLLFEKRRKLYLVLASISIALVLDELWLIRKVITSTSTSDAIPIYNSTINSVIFMIIALLSIILIIDYLRKIKNAV